MNVSLVSVECILLVVQLTTHNIVVTYNFFRCKYIQSSSCCVLGIMSYIHARDK